MRSHAPVEVTAVAQGRSVFLQAAEQGQGGGRGLPLETNQGRACGAEGVGRRREHARSIRTCRRCVPHTSTRASDDTARSWRRMTRPLPRSRWDGP